MPQHSFLALSKNYRSLLALSKIFGLSLTPSPIAHPPSTLMTLLTPSSDCISHTLMRMRGIYITHASRAWSTDCLCCTANRNSTQTGNSVDCGQYKLGRSSCVGATRPEPRGRCTSGASPRASPAPPALDLGITSGITDGPTRLCLTAVLHSDARVRTHPPRPRVSVYITPVCAMKICLQATTTGPRHTDCVAQHSCSDERRTGPYWSTNLQPPPRVHGHCEENTPNDPKKGQMARFRHESLAP